MRRLFAIAGVCVLLSSCGVEELESGTRFISRTQTDPTLIRDDAYANKHRPGGAHANAYLINRVHKSDNDEAKENCSDDRVTSTCNLRVDVNVGYWEARKMSQPDDCNDNCVGKKIWQVTSDTKPTSRCCDVHTCINNPATVVNTAIMQWLEPLRDPYNKADDPIVSINDNRFKVLSFVGDATGKDKPDLIINFVCSETKEKAASGWPTYPPNGWIFPNSNRDCPSSTTTQLSCTRYHTGTDLSPGQLGGGNIKSKPAEPIRSNVPMNIPIIYIGDGKFAVDGSDDNPTALQYDKIAGAGNHDRLDLLHELGHAFGLADTHESGGTDKIGKQPTSLMQRNRYFRRGNTELSLDGRPLLKSTDIILSPDDEAGVQWLYEHHRRGYPTDNCRFPDEYTHKEVGGDDTCEPLHALITLLRDGLAEKALETLIGDRSIEINVRERSTGNTALHYAILNLSGRNTRAGGQAPSNAEKDTYLDIIRRIIRYNGVNLNIGDDDENTGLHLAVRYNQSKAVTLLLGATGIRVQEANEDGDTPLHIAAGSTSLAGYITAMQHEFSPYVGLTNDAGMTAFHLAAKAGRDAVWAFRNYPGGIAGLASVKTDDEFGETALHIAAKTPGQLEVVKLILRGDSTALLNVKNDRDQTALHLAATLSGGSAVVQHLLTQSGIEVNAQDEDGNTALHIAAAKGHAAIVRDLLNKNGIDTAITNNAGRTAADEAALAGRTGVLEVFDGGTTRHGTSSAERLRSALRSGNLDASDCSGEGQALADCRRNTALAILQANDNLDVNDKDSATGNTALHLAVDRYSASNAEAMMDVINRLLNHPRLNPNLVNEADKTPLHLAVGEEDLVRRLLRHSDIDVNQRAGRGQDTALHMAVARVEVKTVAALLRHRDIRVNLLDSDRKTPLHLAVEERNNEITQALVDDRRVNVDAKDGDGDTALHLAAQTGLTNIVETLLSSSSLNANLKDGGGHTALHLAAYRGHADVIAKLLRAPAINVNLKDRSGNTALHLAASGGRASAVEALLEADDIDITLTNNGGRTAFQLATSQTVRDKFNANPDHERTQRRGRQTLLSEACSSSGEDAALTILDEDNPNVNAADSRGTALHCAIDYGHDRLLAELLRERGLDVNKKNSSGETPLHLAVEKSQDDTITALLRHSSIRVNERKGTSTSGDTALLLAVDKKDQAVVSLLLGHDDIDVNAKASNGNTALHRAITKNADDIVTALLRVRGINVNLANNSGDIPLHLAINRKNSDLVTSLLGISRIDVNAKDGSDDTPLHLAIKSKDNDIVNKVLRTAGINVNLKGSNDKTALHLAIENENSDIVSALLGRNRIDVNIKSRGETPLLAALRLGQSDTVTALLRHSSLSVNERNSRGETALLVAAGNGDSDVVRALLAHSSIDVNVKDRSNNTALHLAVNNKRTEIATALLAVNGIDVNVKNNRGETPLLAAQRLALANTFAELLSHSGIRVNERNKSGDTVLLIAVRANDLTNVRLLLKHAGIDVNGKDSAGDTPLHLAVKGQRVELVKELLTSPAIDGRIKNRAGKTVLHLAVENNEANIVTELLKNESIDVNSEVTGIVGESALHLAIAKQIASGSNYDAVIDALLAHPDIDPNLKNRFKESPLLIAVKEERLALVTKLLANLDTEVDTSNSRQKTALMHAAGRGSLDIVRKLLARAADTNLQDDKKFTALHFGCHYGHVEIVRAMLAVRDIDITLEDKWGLTARERAGHRGHPKVVALFEDYQTGTIGSGETLLAALARGDAEDSIMETIRANQGNIAVRATDANNDNTALHYAARLGYGRVVTALLEYDAIAVNASNRRQERPLHLAARRGFTQIVRSLTNHARIQVNARDGSTATALHRASAAGHLEVVRILLAHPNIRPALTARGNFTALHWAAQLAETNIIRALLRRQASLINMKTDTGYTALHYSSWFGHETAVVELLKSSNININLRTEKGDTALHKAAGRNKLIIARHLLEAGASTRISNKDRKKARDIAIEKNFTDMVRLIDSY